MRQKLIIGNWKMHTTTAEAGRLAREGVGGEDRGCVAVCPPFPYLALVGELLKGSRVALGAQNLFPEKEGAFTGEVSPTMLLDLGCRFVLLGHSERPHTLGESDGFINQEAHAVIRRRFGQLFGAWAQTLVIQYGGSVKPENAAALLSRPGVDGALIGGASLTANQFLAIVQAGISESPTEGEST